MTQLTPLYRTQQIRAKEKALMAQNPDPSYLMNAAALAAWQCIADHYAAHKRWVICCGGGHNGGDGWVLAALAAQNGVEVTVVSACPQAELQGAVAEAASKAAAVGVEVHESDHLPAGDLIIDALLGIGWHGTLRLEYQVLINQINDCSVPVVAIDVPSGLNADTGCVSECAVRAAATVTFIAAKVGLYTAVGQWHAGTIHVADLGCNANDQQRPCAQAQQHIVDAPRPRAIDSHKGMFGHALVVVGEPGMSGAGILATHAAIAVGVGKITAVVHDAVLQPMLVHCPSAITINAKEWLASAQVIQDVVLVGPGLGTGQWAEQVVARFKGNELAMVLDADALCLCQHPGFASNHEQTIVTPHPQEAAQMLGVTTQVVQNDRLAAAQKIAENFQVTCVLKGAGTVVAQPNQTPRVVLLGAPALARAGTGDVLAGMIVGLWAQGLTAWQAAITAVSWHGAAGQQAQQQFGDRGIAPEKLLNGWTHE